MTPAPVARWRGSLVLALLGLAVSACASFTITDTKPLPAARLEPMDGEQISIGGYRLSAIPVSDASPDLLVLLAMSGGGKRSASFSYGALKGLRELTIATSEGPRPLLREVDAIAGVSGGSFTAAYYGLHRDATFGRFEADFLYRDTEANIYGIYLLPWNWAWLVDPNVGTNDFMEQVYDRQMFHGATFADLQRRGRPLVAIGATDIAFGSPFLFTQDTFDLICSDLDAFPLSRAVAASNGFPGLFSPVTLTNHAAQCKGRKPEWLRTITQPERDDPRSRIGRSAREALHYLDPQRTRYVHLVDGGVADNLAMRAAGAEMEAVSLAAPGMQARLSKVRKVLVLSIDGQGAQDASVAQRRAVGGIFSVFGLVSGAAIDRFNFETLLTVDQQLKDFVETLRRARCGKAALAEATPCSDVHGELIHISLAGLPDSPEKERLLAIRTGLSIGRENVDLLVDAGRRAVLQSALLREFIRFYAPAAPPRAAGAGPSGRTRS